MISLLVIGNEILSSQIEDTNLKYMLPRLASAGYPVDEVRFVGDRVAQISEAFNQLRTRSLFVISCGGIGPTHDDVTFRACAEAFGVSLVAHPDLVARVREYYGTNFTEAKLAHAIVPANAELVDSGIRHWPIIKIGNCFVLPGLPEIFVKKFNALMKILPPMASWLFAELLTSADETRFATQLMGLQGRFPDVEMGSYPTLSEVGYSARITLKGKDRAVLDKAFGAVREFFEEIEALLSFSEPAIYDPSRIME